MAVQSINVRAEYVSRPNEMHVIWSRLCKLWWRLRPAVQSSLELAPGYKYECIALDTAIPTQYGYVLGVREQSSQSCCVQWRSKPTVCVWRKYTPDQARGLLPWYSGYLWDGHSIHEWCLCIQPVVSGKWLASSLSLMKSFSFLTNFVRWDLGLWSSKRYFEDIC